MFEGVVRSRRITPHSCCPIFIARAPAAEPARAPPCPPDGAALLSVRRSKPFERRAMPSGRAQGRVFNPDT